MGLGHLRHEARALGEVTASALIFMAWIGIEIAAWAPRRQSQGRVRVAMASGSRAHYKRAPLIASYCSLSIERPWSDLGYACVVQTSGDAH